MKNKKYLLNAILVIAVIVSLLLCYSNLISDITSAISLQIIFITYSILLYKLEVNQTDTDNVNIKKLMKYKLFTLILLTIIVAIQAILSTLNIFSQTTFSVITLLIIIIGSTILHKIDNLIEKNKEIQTK